MEIINDDWQLVWSDEFNEANINQKHWDYEQGYIRNNELQWYTCDKKNCYIEEGNLVIQAVEEKGSNIRYTSASINTKGKKSWKYGKFEMRAKLPYGKGIWPAFWTLGIEKPWPMCGEIDIMEMIGGEGGDSSVYATAHWGEEGIHMQYGMRNDLNTGRFSDDYHIFSMEWSCEEVIWYIDNTRCHSMKIDEKNRDEFSQPHYILLNLAVGGDWPGSPDDTTTFPQKYYIDYIRIYQKSTLEL